jgi:uncharacterized protein (TIGR00369 family)
MGNESAPAAPQARRSGYRMLLGYRTRLWQEGYAEVELPIAEQHMNSIGVVHGGVYASLLDVVMGTTVSYCGVPGRTRFSTTISLTTTFLKSATAGLLVATGRLEGVDGRVATASGQILDGEGALLATGQGSFLYFPGSERPEGVPKGEPRG